MEGDRLKSILESLLLAADEPLSVDRLKGVMGEVPRGEVLDALRGLQREYEDAGRGLRLVEVANSFQLRTPKEHADFVRKLTAVKPARMSRANLETLAIIAYRQPVTRAEMEEIRGVNVDGVVSTLLERRLIRIVGRKDVAGKPFLYGTTREFLEAFNLKDLASLPTLQEMEDMTRTEGGPPEPEIPSGGPPLPAGAEDAVMDRSGPGPRGAGGEDGAADRADAADRGAGPLGSGKVPG